MKQVFLKEWRQGHLIALFGLLMAGLIGALWGIFTVAYVRDFRDQENVNGFCGVMYYVLPLVLAVFVGSGVFSAEVERGTLPLLLGLPFTRRAVWFGKLLAGLALAYSAIMLAVVPAAFPIRAAFEEVSFWAAAPDLFIWTVVLFCIAFFWSTICASIMGAVLATIVLFGVLFAGAWVVLGVLGGRLLGTGVLLDAELWMLATCPALLIGSYVGFARGELLQSKRRWVLPSVTALAAFAAIGLALVVVVRWETRYDRSGVERIDWQSVTGGSAVSLLAYGSPVKYRELEARWFRLGEPQYRSKHAVCVDLETGKELLVRREAHAPVVSPDGKLAAVLRGPRPLTWYDEQMSFPARTVEVWELGKHKLLYRGLPEEFKRGAAPNLEGAEWSPDGSWLALSGAGWWQWQQQTRSLLLMRPDGSQAQEVQVEDPRRNYWSSWDWEPSGQSFYLLQNVGRLLRYGLSDRKGEIIWEATASQQLPPQFSVSQGMVAVSPDGRQGAVALRADPYRGPGPGTALPASTDRFLVFIISADGARSQLIFRSPAAAGGEGDLSLLWSRDGKALYIYRYGPAVTSVGGPRSESRAELIVWREGAKAAVVAALPRPSWMYDTALLPDGGLLLSAADRLWSIGADGKVRPMPEVVSRSFAHGRLLGVDERGRAVLHKWEKDDRSYIAAADLKTGELTRIYP